MEAPFFYVTIKEMKKTLDWFRDLLDRPMKVAMLAVVVAFSSLLIGGTFLDLWNLKQEKIKLQTGLDQTLKSNFYLQSKIKQAKSSDQFIGRQAREKLDLVKKDELIFIFENETLFETPTAQR